MLQAPYFSMDNPDVPPEDVSQFEYEPPPKGDPPVGVGTAGGGIPGAGATGGICGSFTGLGTSPPPSNQLTIRITPLATSATRLT